MTATIRKQLENTVLRTVADTTQWLRTRPRGHGELEWKGNDNPVTSYDREAERRIRTALKRFRPTIVGEEYGSTAGGAPFTAYIDPIDGTKSFLRGNAGCAVSLAIAGDDDRIFAAAVGDITSGVVYYADEARTLVLDTVTGRRAPLRQTHPLSKQYLLLNEEAAPLVKQLGDHQYTSQIGGIAGALGMALTAAGVFDGIAFAPRATGGPQAYDIAAGSYLMQRAGLKLTDYAGAPYNFLEPKGGIVAAPKDLHRAVRQVIEEPVRAAERARERAQEAALRPQTYGGPIDPHEVYPLGTGRR